MQITYQSPKSKTGTPKPEKVGIIKFTYYYEKV